MAASKHLIALLRSHIDGDNEQFLSVAMQVAAHEARQGHGNLAQQLRDLVDEARSLKQSRASRPVPIAQPKGDLAALISVNYSDTRLASMVLPKRPEESVDRFRRRVNAAAREEDERVARAGNDEGWVLGPRLRDRGSLHSDVWRGTAADLANRHAIGVFPVGGWWREKPKLERADHRVRYALIVSLRANVEIDLYTEIANAVGIEIDVET